ncbi:MAG: flagellar basal body rod protein FlgB [Calditrichaeota bacterium]|nr:flagellar basal body rod protein FlgB [Calditrichota bacterium]
MADNIIQENLLHAAPGTIALKKGLHAWSLRQKAHAQNIANAETPNYRRVVVDFESKLLEALRQSEAPLAQTDPDHLPPGSSDIENLQATVRREARDPNGNAVGGVDIDQEMAEMAETQLRYMTAVELLKRRYQGLKTAIRGSGQ